MKNGTSKLGRFENEERSTNNTDIVLRDRFMNSYTLSLWTICTLGLLGNVLNGLVLSRKRMRSSTSIILLGLALFDSMVLVTFLFSVIYFGLKLLVVFGFEILEENYKFLWFDLSIADAQRTLEFHQSFLYPLNKIGYTGSVYSTILLTMERYVVVSWPLQARSWLSTTRAFVLTCIVLGFSILLTLPRWFEALGNESEFYMSNEPAPGVQHWEYRWKVEARSLLKQENYIKYYHGWLWISLMYLIPIPLLSLLNFQILRKVKTSSLLGGKSRTRGESDAEVASLTKTILSIITIFIICNTANAFMTWGDIGGLNFDPMAGEPISCIPLILNSSINFVIYCLLGLKFRTELCRLIREWWKCRDRGQLPCPTTTSVTVYSGKGKTVPELETTRL